MTNRHAAAPPSSMMKSRRNTINIRGCAPMHIGIAWPIGHQATRLDQFTVRMHSRQTALGGEVHDARTVVQEQPIRQHEQRTRPLPDDCR